MVNRPKQQGTQFESWMVKWLEKVESIRGARRLPEGGANDLGDIFWTDDKHVTWYAECKATQTLNVTRVLSKARVKSNDGRHTVLLWKRLAKLKDGQKNRRPDGEPVVVVMGLDTFHALIDR